MREGDDTFRPRAHVSDSGTSGIGVDEEKPDAQPRPVRREGDDTFRARDTITEEMRHESAPAHEESKGENVASPAASGNKAPSFWFLSASFGLATFVLSALLVKFAFLIRDALALPVGMCVLALTGIFSCLAVIAYALFILVRVLWKLPRIKQAAKKDATGKEVSCKDQAKAIHEYLVLAFQGKNQDRGVFEKACADYEREIGHVAGCPQELPPLLSKKLRTLLSNFEDDDYEDWMVDFLAFEKMQDDAASNCIMERAKCVFLKTGISPWRFVDAMAVLYHSVMMTTELANLYRRGMSRFQAFRLVIDGIFAIGVASVAQDALEKAAEELTKHVFTTGSKLVNGLLSKVAAKVAEGSLNAALVYRLGRRMQSRFKPLVEQVDPVSPVGATRFWWRMIVFVVVVALAVVASLYLKYRA